LIDDKDYRSLEKLIFSGVTGYAADMLPDIIEPALSPHHRKFFHSWFVFAAASYGLYKIYNWQTESEIQKWMRWALLAGTSAYLVHLLLDSKTPKGLLLIGGFKLQIKKLFVLPCDQQAINKPYSLIFQ